MSRRLCSQMGKVVVWQAHRAHSFLYCHNREPVARDILYLLLGIVSQLGQRGTQYPVTKMKSLLYSATSGLLHGSWRASASTHVYNETHDRSLVYMYVKYLHRSQVLLSPPAPPVLRCQRNYEDSAAFSQGSYFIHSLSVSFEWIATCRGESPCQKLWARFKGYILSIKDYFTQFRSLAFFMAHVCLM